MYARNKTEWWAGSKKWTQVLGLYPHTTTPRKKKSTNSKSLQLQLREEEMLSLQNCPKAERTEK